MSEIKILGVCGSPIKGGNTEAFLAEALKAAGELPGVAIEAISLSGRNLAACQQCNWCLAAQKEGQFCRIDDDMTDIFPRVLATDGLLLASPVHFLRLSGQMACFLDRLRAFGHGKYYRGQLKDKVGGALAVGWARNSGIETTLGSMNYAFSSLGMLSVYEAGTAFGAGGVTTPGGTGRFVPEDRLAVLKDEYGLDSAHRLARRMVELIKMVKLGREALGRESEQ